MNFYDNYFAHPNLVMEIIEYFSIDSGISEKSVLKFCSRNKPSVDPQIVVAICEKLCTAGTLAYINRGGLAGQNNNYINIIKDRDAWNANKHKYAIQYNAIVYGFEYIYDIYKSLVVPIVYTAPDGIIGIGTGFKCLCGIATAKHCLEGAKSLSIRGYSGSELNGKRIFISENENLDIAFIGVAREDEEDYTLIDDGRVTQEVLAMGYPQIPGFTEFLTAEKATISAVPNVSERLTPTTGSITAFGTNIFANTDLMLITAKIRGGNSGGPIINQLGQIVGIACQAPSFEGNYDDLGYGVAVPSKYLLEIITQKSHTMELPQDCFVDFPN